MNKNNKCKYKENKIIIFFILFFLLVVSCSTIINNRKRNPKEDFRIKEVREDNILLLVDENTNLAFTTKLACLDDKQSYKYKDTIKDLLLKLDNPKLVINYIGVSENKVLVSEIYLNNINLNQHLIAKGVAVINPATFRCLDKNGYLYSQKIARDNELGVWNKNE